jgi:hypothetical protein
MILQIPSGGTCKKDGSMGNCASGLCVVCAKNLAETNRFKADSIVARGKCIDRKVQISVHLPLFKI